MVRIHFLNVENGDCTIIEHEIDNRITVIDVCNARIEGVSTESLKESAEFAKSAAVTIGNLNQKNHPENPIAYLEKMGIETIFRYIQTHPDMDHMDGIKDLFKITVCNFWDINNNKEINNFDNKKYRKEDWDCYQRKRKSTSNPKALIYYAGDENEYYRSDGISILAPTRELNDAAVESGDYNDSSYVLLLETHGRKIIFAGDSGEKMWNHILKNYSSKVTNIDFLLAPHHGRKTGGNSTYLDTLKPRCSLLGNTEANTKYLDYAAWNNRSLLDFTKNEGGNYVLEIEDDGKMSLYCSNGNFIDALIEKDIALEKQEQEICGMSFYFLCSF